MATKVKPSRLNVTGTPQVGDVPVYVDEDSFSWGAGGGGGTGDVVGPASSTDGDIVLFDGTTGKLIKDSGVGLSSKLDASALSDNNYGGAWSGDTTHTPTKNALYTKIHTMDVEIGNKAADNTVVKLTGNQTIAGTKTFSTSPVVPSKTSDATNTGTAIATEAQVYKKQDALVNQANIKSINGNSLLGSGDLVVAGKEYNAGEGIEILNGPDYSAMQGPAPSGFHVPSSDEWTAVKTVWTTLGGGSSDGTNFGIALKLPKAGVRSSYDGYVISGFGNYWSCSRSIEYENTAYLLVLGSIDIDINACAEGFTVRCFKDTPVIPTSSWTKLYGTSIESGGIFWSSTDGLISLSSDGSNWITIADKNLGATTVWNNGDVLSETNCGGYFQWGNNYMFPFTGSVTTSYTQVDASAYGPGNYYSSSTFIIMNESWDSSKNANLRGGVTGVITNAITNTGVLSVNGQTGDVTISGLPSGGTVGQVLQMTANGPEWVTLS